MAITIKIEPQEIQSAYNEVITVLDSTNKSEPKFQYIIDINVAGVFSSRLKVQSNPQGFGIVNLQKHLESYISSNIDVESKDIFKQITDSYTDYDIVLSEEYVLTTSFTSVSDNGGFCQYNYAAPHNFIDEDFVTVSGSSVIAYDGIQEVTSVPSTTAIVTTETFSATATGDTVLSSGTVTVVPDAAVFTGSKYILNNVLKWVDVPNWDATDYDIDVADVGLMFSNLPNPMTTKINDRITMNLYNNHIVKEASYLKVVSDNRGTFYFDNPYSTATDDKRFLSVGVGAFDILNGTLSGVPAQATLPVIDEDTKSYTIELTDLALDSSSVQQTFNLDHRCSVYEGFKLMYLNRGGSFSPFNFELADKKTIKVKKTNFKQNYGEYNVASNSYGWESSDRGETRLDTDINESYALTSNYMRESYGNLIEDLIISPEVYHLELVVSYTDPVATSNMTDTAGFLTLFTASTATLSVGDTVLLEGVSLPEYNGEHIITSIVSGTSFIVDMDTTSLPVSFGTWSLKSNEDRRLRAVDVDTSSIKIKRRLTDNLINYSVKIRYSNKNIVQR